MYGKISRIIKDEDRNFGTVGDRTTIEYSYDAGGNRINKTVTNSSGIAKTTWYVRDATGNVMSIYESGIASLNNGDLTQTELHLYGSSRLGIFHPDRNVLNPALNNGGIATFTRGNKFFELSNHLGNVLATVSDKKIGVDGNTNGIVDYYVADVITANDYYPFGSLMPGRKFAANSSYRYGFNGKENDNDVKGEGNQQDYGMRIYDPRLGRFLSVDPLQIKYTSLTPYNFVADNPINAIDPDGRVIIFINGLWGPPTGAGKGGTVDYWGSTWVDRVKRRIGDPKALFFDGAMGGTLSFGGKSNLYEKNRVEAGLAMGYKSAKSIIDNLSEGETIKFVTNSMGAAFERGFSEGLLKYQKEENERRKSANAYIDKRISEINSEKAEYVEFLKGFGNNMTKEAKSRMENHIKTLDSKMSDLNGQKKEQLNIRIEMVIDLSPHQTDEADPNAEKNYFMLAQENMSYVESTLGVGEPKHVLRSWFLGKMKWHHSSGADTERFPRSEKPSPN